MTLSAIQQNNTTVNNIIATALAISAATQAAFNAQGANATITVGDPALANRNEAGYQLRDAAVQLRQLVPSLRLDYAGKFGLSTVTADLDAVLGADGNPVATPPTIGDGTSGTVTLQTAAANVVTGVNAVRVFVASTSPTPNMQSLDPAVAAVSTNVAALVRLFDRLQAFATPIAAGV
jgi:hypothetical protein